jgi:membrane-associated phospholipid phosphatase
MKTVFRAAVAAGIVLLSIGMPAHAQVRATLDRFGDSMRLLLPAGAALLAVSHDDTEGLRELAYSMLLTTGATELVKYSVNSAGPDGSARAFPSGHTSIAFASAAFVQERYGFGVAAPMYGLAAITGYERVRTHHHFSKDVLAGALIGVGSAELVTHRFTPHSALSVSYAQHTLLASFATVW